MRKDEVIQLINSGGTDLARKKLKRLAVPDRLKTLSECIPYVNASPATLNFFRQHFSQEIGSIMMSENDLPRAAEIYRAAKEIPATPKP